jgi:hypothetical protein
VLISLFIDHAAAGSQLVPKLTGGVNKTLITTGVMNVKTAHPKRPNPNIQFATRENFKAHS